MVGRCSVPARRAGLCFRFSLHSSDLNKLTDHFLIFRRQDTVDVQKDHHHASSRIYQTGHMIYYSSVDFGGRRDLFCLKITSIVTLVNNESYREATALSNVDNDKPVCL